MNSVSIDRASSRGTTDSAATAALVAAIESENWEEAETILREHEDVDANARTTDWSYALLRAAAEEGAVETCRLLLQRGADVNALDQNSMTAIMGCVVGGDFPDCVTLLLEAKADASLKTDDDFTALSWATRLDRVEAIRLLRAAGMTGASTCF